MKEITYCFLEINKDQLPDFSSAKYHIENLSDTQERQILNYVDASHKQHTLISAFNNVVKMWVGQDGSSKVLDGDKTDILVVSSMSGIQYRSLYIFIASGAAHVAGFYADSWEEISKRIKLSEEHLDS